MPRQRPFRDRASHHLQRLAIDVRREIRADRRPRDAAVGRAEHHVRSHVVAPWGRSRTSRSACPSSSASASAARFRFVPGAAPPGQSAAARASRGRRGSHVRSCDSMYDRPRIGRIDAGVEAVAAADVEAVAVGDAVAVPRRARHAPVAVVLQPAADGVGILHVDADFVELPDRQVVAEQPGRRRGPTRSTRRRRRRRSDGSGRRDRPRARDPRSARC